MSFFKKIIGSRTVEKGKNVELEKMAEETPKEEKPIVFKTSFELKRIEDIEVKVSEFCNFINMAVKYGDREIIAIGTGVYDEKAERVKVESIYPVQEGSGSRSSVSLGADMHKLLDQTLEHWKEKPECAVFHTHPGFSTFKSGTDDGRGIRMASLFFGGVAVMVIVDPFSRDGIDVSAYAIDPGTKHVNRIPFKLVP